jgi:hypothetical protein
MEVSIWQWYVVVLCRANYDVACPCGNLHFTFTWNTVAQQTTQKQPEATRVAYQNKGELFCGDKRNYGPRHSIIQTLTSALSRRQPLLLSEYTTWLDALLSRKDKSTSASYTAVGHATNEYSLWGETVRVSGEIFQFPFQKCSLY